MIKIAPSILSADFAHLADEIRKVTDAGAEYVHIDVMDGTFVPNITLGSPVVQSLRKVSDAEFDVHLMVEHPETQIESFAKAGANIITFHAEAAKHHHRIVQQIKAAGCKAGIALNPGTSLAMVEELLADVDMVLIMTVNPGFGGQKFISSQLEKIHMLYHTIQDMDFDCDIEVDGGINAETSKLVRQAGANILVAGSAVYGAPDAAEAIRAIRG
ncbi:MAG: ribulose-phosphate 3-epimerase [Selenomonas montiformis]|uniref:ribulose-phosphate 3-epimerase n=1 Tax=Selenomonas montiformis TaxID=2652285 RepID=UPI002A8CA457|nr:ribulose-phosphate 3-epimerase [Selenomonas montiformis]